MPVPPPVLRVYLEKERKTAGNWWLAFFRKNVRKAFDRQGFFQMVGWYPVKSFIYNDLSYFADPARQVLVSLPSLKRKMYPIHIGGFASKERI